MSGLIFEQKIDLPYTYTAGRAQRAFLRGLAQGKLIGSHAGGPRYVPARAFAPDGSRLPELGGGRRRGRGRLLHDRAPSRRPRVRARPRR